MTTLRVTFLDNNSNSYDLYFLLHNTSLSRRWQELLKEYQKDQTTTIHSSLINYSWESLPTVVEAMNETIAEINILYDRQLPQNLTIEILNEHILNSLHEEYEIYGTRVQELVDNGKYTTELHDSFLLLNEQIHIIEKIIENKEIKNPSMSVLFDYYPQGLHYSILERDKLFLTTKFSWGGLYLGYNTLGKDWLEVARHNDLEVIERNEVRVQERFAVESWIRFDIGGQDFSVARRFEKWYDGLSEELQAKVPIDDLNKLGLGRYEIGKIIIAGKLLQFHDNFNDWLAPDSEVAARWNREVFTTFRRIVSVVILTE
jgi:hypothetical protein